MAKDICPPTIANTIAFAAIEQVMIVQDDGDGNADFYLRVSTYIGTRGSSLPAPSSRIWRRAAAAKLVRRRLTSMSVDFGLDQSHGVTGRGLAGEAHLPRGPEPHQPVAARGDLEGELLLPLESALRHLLAILEHHGALLCRPPSWSSTAMAH
jgi:hypothetical protein